MHLKPEEQVYSTFKNREIVHEMFLAYVEKIVGKVSFSPIYDHVT